LNSATFEAGSSPFRWAAIRFLLDFGVTVVAAQ
jgi:hypothetical protein